MPYKDIIFRRHRNGKPPYRELIAALKHRSFQISDELAIDLPFYVQKELFSGRRTRYVQRYGIFTVDRKRNRNGRRA